MTTTADAADSMVTLDNLEKTNEYLPLKEVVLSAIKRTTLEKYTILSRIFTKVSALSPSTSATRKNPINCQAVTCFTKRV